VSDTRLHWRGLVGDYRAHVTYAVSLSAVVNLLYLAPTIFMMQVYDRVVPTGGILTLIVLTLILAVTLAVLSALEWVRGRTLQQLSLRLDRTLGRTMADRQLQGNAPIRDGVPMMREFDSLRNVVAGPGIVALLDLPWTPIYCLVAFLIHPALGSFVLVSGILLVGIAILNQRHVHRATLSAHQATSLAYANHEMTLRRAEIVRALGMRDGLVTRHRSERETGLAATAELQRISAAYGAAVKFTRLFLQSAALAVGAMLAVEQQISVGSIIAASVLLSRALQPVEQLVAAWPGLVQARATLSRMGDLFARTDGDRIRTALPDPQGRLELRQVSVRDGKGGLLLNGVSASIPPGEITCVIGPSGAGKTTLARVATGALSIDAGEVTIDGARREDWDQNRLARRIGYLPQNDDLLAGTIAENISRFAVLAGEDRAIVDAAVVQAACQAHVHDLILRLPQGYDTPVDPTRPHLSAGQVQRVMLARALYGDPALLVLDEPNSALDSDGEEALASALAAARHRGAATMVISHRTGILGIADRLIVLHNGGVAHSGPRDEVLAALHRGRQAATVVPLHERAGA
jgi:ATP-binding cassette subfamily C protein